MTDDSTNLSTLLIGASDDFAQLEDLQILLKIGLNEADRPSIEACKRLAFLVQTYLCQAEPWLQEVRFGLERLKKQVIAKDVLRDE